MASSIILNMHSTGTSRAFPVRILPYKGYRQKSHGPSHAHIPIYMPRKDTAVGVQGSQGYFAWILPDYLSQWRCRGDDAVKRFRGDDAVYG